MGSVHPDGGFDVCIVLHKVRLENKCLFVCPVDLVQFPIQQHNAALPSGGLLNSGMPSTLVISIWADLGSISRGPSAKILKT